MAIPNWVNPKPFESQHDKTKKNECASGEDPDAQSDQSFTVSMHRSRRDGGMEGGPDHPPPPPPPPSLKNHKNIGFLSNTGLDPLKITKLSSQHSMLGHHWHASETPFKWHSLAG